MADSDTINDLIHDWLEVKKELNELKQKELSLRKVIIDESKKIETNEYNIQVKVPIRYTIDRELLSTLELNDEEKRAIRWKPELDVARYKHLPHKNMLNFAVTAKEGLPQLIVTKPVM